MAYPSSLDALRTDLTGADDAAVVDHAGLHNAVNAAVMAVQAELGLDPSGAAATVAARLATIEADSRWTNARTPTAHKASHATGGSDVLSPADIGAATSAQGGKADTAVQPTLIDAKGDLLVGVSDGVVGRVPVGLDGTVLLADSAQAAGVGWGSLGNLLSDNQARPTTLGGWPITGGAETAPGVYQASGTSALNVYLPAGQAIPVTPGRTYTAYSRVTCVGRTTSARIRWITSGNADVSSAYGPQVSSGVSQVTAEAPPNAAKAMIYASNSPVGAAGDTITVHEAGFWRGAGGMWQPPGLPISALSPWIVESATSGRACFVWDQVNSRPQMVYYDSGWRDISSLLVNGWTGSLLIRRTDNMVMIRSSNLSGSGATSDTIATIPSGFRSEATISQILPANATDATVVRAQMTSAGVLTMARATVTAQSATWSMSTTNALAATLPGDPVGTIPSA